ncbi:hypothetical protein C8Q80DRAFT_245096 [Daedaleopsis nitida]|nr:hypothetical protein C8Q80DRAFT_245096 [Daedaleopsis nitida]
MKLLTLIWLKHPVLWHSSRVPSAYNYVHQTTPTPRRLRSSSCSSSLACIFGIQVIWTTDGPRVVYSFCVGIIFFRLVKLLLRLRHNERVSNTVHKISFYQHYGRVEKHWPLSCGRTSRWGIARPSQRDQGWISIAILPSLLVMKSSPARSTLSACLRTTTLKWRPS